MIAVAVPAWPQRAWTVGMTGVDHFSRICPYLARSVAYRHSRADRTLVLRPVCQWCLNHPEKWDG